MFTSFAFSSLMGAAANFADVSAVADADISSRNNHMLLSSEMRLLAAQPLGATLTKSRISAPTLNAFGMHKLWPIQPGATQPDDPRIPDYRNYMMKLPVGEDIAVQQSNSGAGEQQWCFLLLAPYDWNTNLPSGVQRITIEASYTITSTANAWSALGTLAPTENLRGGKWTVVGMNVFDANTLFARLIFPRGNVKDGRRMKPGCFVQNALANRPWPDFMGNMGVWGSFNTTEPPQIEIFSVNAAAHTGVVMLDCIFEGDRAIL